MHTVCFPQAISTHWCPPEILELMDGEKRGVYTVVLMLGTLYLFLFTSFADFINHNLVRWW